jgi:cytochrome c556
VPAAKPDKIRKAVLDEHRKGNRTVRGIRDALKKRGIAISIGTVSAYLSAASAASEAIAAPVRKSGKAAKKKTRAAPARAELVAEVADAAQAHAAAWERLYQAHGQALAEVERRLAALGKEAACPKCGGGFEAPADWTTLQKLKSFANDLLEDIARLRPAEPPKPEDDPANVEAARVVAATLRARVEAHAA